TLINPVLSSLTVILSDNSSNADASHFKFIFSSDLENQFNGLNENLLISLISQNVIKSICELNVLESHFL
ncbi:MAG: hypothetical protein QQN51_05640, partial [Nitrosopumilus sp.]